MNTPSFDAVQLRFHCIRGAIALLGLAAIGLASLAHAGPAVHGTTPVPPNLVSIESAPLSSAGSARS